MKIYDVTVGKCGAKMLERERSDVILKTKK